MALVIIAGDCMRCGKCVAACPEGAISYQNKAFVIAPNLCTECQKCQSACPVHCIQLPSDR